MEEVIDRRQCIALVGAASIAGAAGCLGGGEQPNDERGESSGGNGSGNGDDDGAGTEEEDSEPDESFDFPPGADEEGIVTETVVAGGRQATENAGRYRIRQTHEMDYGDAPRDEMTFTYDVAERAVHERLRQGSSEIDRWVTPERTVARAVDTESDRTSRWRTTTAEPGPDATGTFESYPFAATAVPSLLESAAFEFEGIETDAEQPYARYAGELTGSGLELPQPRSARIDYQVESISGGRVSLWLTESGAIRAVDYEIVGGLERLTREGREVVEFEADGQVEFTYSDAADAGLEALSRPAWAEDADSADVREFGFTETSLGRTYKLVSGPPLPGSVELEYAEFYLTAQFDGEQYIARYTPRQEFDQRAGVVARFDGGDLELDWRSMEGQDVFEKADRIEISVCLYAPGEDRFMISHEERYP